MLFISGIVSFWMPSLSVLSHIIPNIFISAVALLENHWFFRYCPLLQLQKAEKRNLCLCVFWHRNKFVLFCTLQHCFNFHFQCPVLGTITQGTSHTTFLQASFQLQLHNSFNFLFQCPLLGTITQGTSHTTFLQASSQLQQHNSFALLCQT